MARTLQIPGAMNGTLSAKRLGVDTYRQAVVFMREDCPVCRSEGFEALTQVRVHAPDKSIIAILNVITTDLIGEGEAGLSEEAWRRLGVEDGTPLTLDHAPPLESFAHVRAKMYGHRLDYLPLKEVLHDIKEGFYPDVHVAAFLTACAGNALDLDEITALTEAMVDVGQRLTWPTDCVVDKHCVGGLAGNRTTPIVVAIAAAAGLTIPKTSSRAITSPAGTADVMATMTCVNLDLETLQRVVREHGGCLAWGGSVGLSPVDDLLIRIERALDVDSVGQLVASILSKKAAAGSTRVLIDIPWGPTAKLRSLEAASALARDLEEVGRRIGMAVTTLLTDGSQPVGRGIGPALEAHDVLAVLRLQADAPHDLRSRALTLAGRLLELGGAAPLRAGGQMAKKILDSGAAWERFLAICEAQGGFQEPPRAALLESVTAPRAGVVTTIDNRRLSRAAKLAGAPADVCAGIELHAHVDDRVERGQSLFTVHAESPGELNYAMHYVRAQGDIFRVEPDDGGAW